MWPALTGLKNDVLGNTFNAQNFIGTTLILDNNNF